MAEISRKPGYSLLPSKKNPRVRRWQRVYQRLQGEGRGSVDASGILAQYEQMRSPAAIRDSALVYARMKEGQPMGPDDAAKLAMRMVSGPRGGLLVPEGAEGYGAADHLVTLVTGGRYTGKGQWRGGPARKGAPAGGQVGGDFYALMRDLTDHNAPILVDAMDAHAAEAWGKAAAEWWQKQGGRVVGFLPRVSSFPSLAQLYAGHNYDMLAPEVAMVVRVPERNLEDILGEYYRRSLKDPLRDELAEEYARMDSIRERMGAIEERYRRRYGHQFVEKVGNNPEYRALAQELRGLDGIVSQRVNENHIKRYQKGEVIAPAGWIDPDMRIGVPVEGWGESRAILAPGSMTWLVSEGGQTNIPKRSLWVSPSLAQYLSPDVMRLDGLGDSTWRYYAIASGYNGDMATILAPGWFGIGGRAYTILAFEPVLEGQTVDEATEDLAKDPYPRIVRDNTGEPWLVVFSVLEAHPAEVRRPLLSEVRGIPHTVLMNRQGQYLYLTHYPEDGFTHGEPVADFRGKTGIPKEFGLKPQTDLWLEVMEKLLARMGGEGKDDAGRA